MFSKNLAAVAAFGALLGLASVSHADTSRTVATCVLAQHKVLSVVPYNTSRMTGRAAIQVLSGASVYIQAEPGLTAEFLRLQIMQRTPGTKQCVLDVSGVDVRVESSGAGFWVNLVARDDANAQEILRRAKRLVG